MINQVNNANQWKLLLSYLADCLKEENRLKYVIKPKDINKSCFFLKGLDGDFLRQDMPSYAISFADRTWRERLQRFVLGDPHSSRPPSVAFAYPFFVDDVGRLMPLMFVSVSGTRTESGVGLTRQSPETEPNLAAIWGSTPGGREISLDHVFAKFDSLDEQGPGSGFDSVLDLLLSELEETSGFPVQSVAEDKWTPHRLPRHAVYFSPVLCHVTTLFTRQLIKELDQLKRWHGWDEVPDALRQLLTKAAPNPYPHVPEPAQDPRVYALPVNDSQRKAVTAAAQCPLTIVTGPPGTGKSQLIANIVGDAILNNQTVLIASKNNRAVDVISERFLSQIDYPGSLRTGSLPYRRQLPTQMQQIFAPVRSGRIQNQKATVDLQYRELLSSIDAQEKLIGKTRRLSQDQEAYQSEVGELAKLLPADICKSLGRARILMEEEEGSKLAAAVRRLSGELDILIEQRDALVSEMQQVLGENREGLVLLKQLEALEYAQGVSFDEMRSGLPLDSFDDMEQYLIAWKNIVDLFQGQDQLAALISRARQARKQAAEESKILPERLVPAVALSAEQTGKDQATILRQSLQALVEETRALSDEYDPLVASVQALVDQSSLVQHALALLDSSQPTENRPSEPFDLDTLSELCRNRECLLAAHKVSLERAKLLTQAKEQELEQNSRLEEFDSTLQGLESATRAARQRVPTSLIVSLVPASEEGSPHAWQIAAQQMDNLRAWCQRVSEGRVSIRERLRRAASRSWATRSVAADFEALEPAIVDLGILELGSPPPDDAPLDDWVRFLSDRVYFAQAAELLARTRYALQQRGTFIRQMETDKAALEQGLTTAKDELLLAVASLPEVLAEAMLAGDWPVEAVDDEHSRWLEMLDQQSSSFAPRYAKVLDELGSLLSDHPTPEYLRSRLGSLRVSDDGRQSGLPYGSTRPHELTEVVSTWLQFEQAVAREQEALAAQDELSQAEARLQDCRSRLPPKICREVSFTDFPHTEEAIQEMQISLSALDIELQALVERWQELQTVAAKLLQENSTRSRALARAIERAPSDPDYLPGLAGERVHRSPEQLLSELKMWMVILQYWRSMFNLVTVNEQLTAMPTLADSLRRRAQLLERRQAMAGDLLTEQWRYVAGNLEPGTVPAIGRYLDAAEALAGNAGGRWRQYKQQAEAYFEDVLRLFPVWSTTNLSTHDLPLRGGLFDCVVIDEASQCDLASALPLLFRAKRIVIIGDLHQLRHVATLPQHLQAKVAARHDIGPGFSYTQKSLFDLAASSVAEAPSEILLDEHYRSHPEIINFSNRNFYEELKVRTDLSGIPAHFLSRGCGVFWIDVKGKAQRPGPSQIYNTEEEQAVSQLVGRVLRQMENLDMQHAEIGVVTPFRSQANRIKDAIGQQNIPERKVLVGTVHTYQGDERDVMIFSTVATKNLPENTFGFMAHNPNLLNVAVTRARLSLIIVGDHGFFRELPRQSCYQKLAVYAEELGQVYAEPGTLPLFLPLDPEEKPFALGSGVALDEGAPYANRMTLRRLLASCDEYLWWYDPYMSIEAIDALSLSLSGSDGKIGEVRLLTSEMFWQNRKEEPKCLTKRDLVPLKRELGTQGVKFQLAVTSYDRDKPPAHDRYLFSANQTVNMPPIKNIYQQTARLAEFLPSTVGSDRFESWWQQAKVVFD